ncbi:potassium/proton antiporter [Streptomyces violaceorubidus]
MAGVTGARDALNIVFVLVVLFTLLQGPTLPAVARWTGVTRPDALREIQVETAPLDLLDADLLTVSVPPGSRLHGVTVSELRLPHPTVVTLVIRDSTSLVPDRDTVLRAGDELLLITTPRVREAAERRLRAIGRRGRLARWLGEHGAPESEHVGA